jgi:hypothetical protein
VNGRLLLERDQPAVVIRRVRREQPQRIFIGFADDFVTTFADVWNRSCGDYDLLISAGHRGISNRAWLGARAGGKLNTVPEVVSALITSLKYNRRRYPNFEYADRIDSIHIAGHGGMGAWQQWDPAARAFIASRLDVADLRDRPPGSPEWLRWESLRQLRAYWAADNRGLTLLMCDCAMGADGRLFLQELARTIGANVTAWDDMYEIRATGKEFTATPSGRVAQTGDTARASLLRASGDLPRYGKGLYYFFSPVLWGGRLFGWW